MAKTERKAIDKVFTLLGVAITAMLLVAGSLAWYVYKFATDNVRTELLAQKQSLFQGETLRGLLLGDGYAYWTFGLIDMYAAMAASTWPAFLSHSASATWLRPMFSMQTHKTFPLRLSV